MLDFFLCVIWLPIGVSKTYGFRSAKDVFTMTCAWPDVCADSDYLNDGVPIPPADNGTGAPPVWNWMLSMYARLLYVSSLAV